MKLAIYPGSFDPVTNGHLNVIERASKLVDHLIVAVLDNPNKQSMFTMGERVHMLKKVTETLSNVEIDSSHKLLYEYAQEKIVNFLFEAFGSMLSLNLNFNERYCCER